jgi:hypothetical protein
LLFFYRRDSCTTFRRIFIFNHFRFFSLRVLRVLGG